jgi:hypothetical protein
VNKLTLADVYAYMRDFASLRAEKQQVTERESASGNVAPLLVLPGDRPRQISFVIFGKDTVDEHGTIQAVLVFRFSAIGFAQVLLHNESQPDQFVGGNGLSRGDSLLRRDRGIRSIPRIRSAANYHECYQSNCRARELHQVNFG